MVPLLIGRLRLDFRSLSRRRWNGDRVRMGRLNADLVGVTEGTFWD